MEVIIMKEINLKNYRAPNSTSFSGRTQGENVRKELKLSVYDSDDSEVAIKIPSDTTSFNPSFFLGLLYNSIERLGLEKFRNKYHIIYETENALLKQALEKNIADGFRNAANSMNNKNSFNIF
jgi:hypothetical protein